MLFSFDELHVDWDKILILSGSIPYTLPGISSRDDDAVSAIFSSVEAPVCAEENRFPLGEIEPIPKSSVPDKQELYPGGNRDIEE